jgi:Zn-dependent protease with chaperone function
MREDRHRRAILLSLGVLIVLGTSPVVGHHFFPASDTLFAGRDHVADVCLIALHILLAPVHGVFHLLFSGGVLWATVGRARAIVGLRRTLALLPAEHVRPGSDVALAALRAGVTIGRVRIVRGLPLPAFTAGWLRPVIYVAGELSETLSADELTAVIAHEGAHVAARDPARVSVLRFLADSLFYLPALRRLADDVADEAEILADDVAALAGGIGSAAVASAIINLAIWERSHRGQVYSPLAAVGFTQRDILERRVRRLLGEETYAGTHVTRASVVAAFAVLFLAGLSGVVMAHPISTPAAIVEEAHCLHHQGFALSHLFCLGVHPSAHTRSDCPHARMRAA